MKKVFLALVSVFFVFALLSCGGEANSGSTNFVSDNLNYDMIKEYYSINSFNVQDVTSTESNSFNDEQEYTEIGNLFYRVSLEDSYRYFTKYNNSMITYQDNDIGSNFGEYYNEISCDYAISIRNEDLYDLYAFDGTKIASYDYDINSEFDIVYDRSMKFHVYKFVYDTEELGYIIISEFADPKIVTQAELEDFNLNEYKTTITGIDFSLVTDKGYYPFFTDFNDQYYYKRVYRGINIYQENDNKIVNTILDTNISYGSVEKGIIFDNVILSQESIILTQDTLEYDYKVGTNKYELVTTLYNITTGETIYLDANFRLTDTLFNQEDRNVDDEFIELGVTLIENQQLSGGLTYALFKSDGTFTLNPFGSTVSSVSYSDDIYYHWTENLLYNKDFEIVSDNVEDVIFDKSLYIRSDERDLSIISFGNNEVVFEGDYYFHEAHTNGAVIFDAEGNYYFYNFDLNELYLMFDEYEYVLYKDYNVLITYNRNENQVNMFECRTGEKLESQNAPDDFYIENIGSIRNYNFCEETAFYNDFLNSRYYSWRLPFDGFVVSFSYKKNLN